jgi:hypothetical protein
MMVGIWTTKVGFHQSLTIGCQAGIAPSKKVMMGTTHQNLRKTARSLLSFEGG